MKGKEMIREREVRKERTGWRDLNLSKLHESNQIKMYDFLVNEYDMGKSVALINYIKAGSYNGYDWSLIKYCLQRKNKEYYFTVEYDYKIRRNKIKMNKFIVHPENYYAKKRFPNKMELSEPAFIQFLYEIRNKRCSMEEATSLCKDDLELDMNHLLPGSIISKRHRQYGWDVPCVDIDCMVTNEEEPYLFIEYKHNGSRFEIGKSFSDKGISDLGVCEKEKPVLLVFYDSDTFTIKDGFNDVGRTIVNQLECNNFDVDDYFKYIKNIENFKSP